MADIINCPSCKRKLQVPETLLGQDVQCPTCSATFEARIAGQDSKSDRHERQAENMDDDRHEDRQPRRPDRSDEYDDDYQKPRRRDLAPHRGGLVLTLGILGFFIGVTGPIAWILGNSDMAQIKSGQMDPDGEGLTQAGRVLGIISTVLLLIQVVGCCGMFGLGAVGNMH
jgi:hypothetical protein